MTKLVIVGQGYVGLPLAQGATQGSHSVTGLDLNQSTVDNLNAGVSHIDDLSNQDIQAMLRAGYRASADPAVIREADVVVICVPTPLGDGGGPDLTAVIGAAETVAANMSDGTLIVLESTTYPGTTDNLILPILEANGMKLDRNFSLAFSPERIDPGNKIYGLKNTPKVVGGASKRSTELAADFYATFIDTVVRVKGAREAETAKLLENTYRHINIALVNEMARFCHDLDIDLWNVIDAAKTKPFGFQAFYPGPGVGGHCIPIDPNYLSYEVRRSLGYPFKFVELAEEVNKSMPAYVVSRVQDLLNDAGRALNGSAVLLLGVTYKANIADQRESPATQVAELLMNKGASVSYQDPRVDEWRVGGRNLRSAPHLYDAVESADVVILLQNHVEYEVDTLSNKAAIFFDTRGASTSESAVRL